MLQDLTSTSNSTIALTPQPKYQIGTRILCCAGVFCYEGEVMGYSYVKPNLWTENEGWSYTIFCDTATINGRPARDFCPIQCDLPEGSCVAV